MRRTFSARHNAILSHLSPSWGMAALALALAAVIMRALLPGAFWTITAPLLRAADAAGHASSSLFSGFADASALTKQVSDLASENAALGTENRRLSAEVADLTALLGSGPAPKDGIVAGVIARPPESPYDTLVLGAGEDDGVAAGMEAFGDGGVPLGFVTATAPNAAKVTLFSAPGAATEAWVGSAKVAVTLEGHGGGVLRAEVSRSATVAAGDAVFTGGPGALPLGSVVRVDSDPASPSLTLQIRPAVNLYTATTILLRDTGRGSMGTLSATTTPL